jgi:photosystem II stability/assembly factor-like uncharacterized protein
VNGERRDPIEAFLEDLGHAPVPPGLAQGVTSRVRADVPSGRRPKPWVVLVAAACLAAAVVGVVVIGSGRQRFISPPRQTPTASQTVAPTPSAVAAPIKGSWQLTLPLFQKRTFRLEVADQSGRLVGARVVNPVPDDLGAAVQDPFALDIRPVPGNAREVLVGWLVVVCEYRGRLVLDQAATSLVLELAPSPGCDLAPIAQAVILEFAVDIDASALTGRQSRDPLVALDQFVPSAIAFVDQEVGWIGGTTPDADALVLHTLHNGSEWAPAGLGEGRVVELAGVDRTHAYATLECAEHQFNCSSGTFRWDDDFGGWGQMTNERFVHVDFAGDAGIAVVLPDDTTTPIVPELRLTEDAGDTWSPIDDPCPATMNLAGADRTSSTGLLVLCLAEGGTGGTFKTLLASNDAGRTWIERSSTEGDGGMFVSGTPSGFDIDPDRTGWLWGSRMPLLQTTDFGTTWSALDIADGDVRIVEDAAYLGAGSGFVLVHDPDRPATLHMWTNGRAWIEIGAWPVG